MDRNAVVNNYLNVSNELIQSAQLLHGATCDLLDFLESDENQKAQRDTQAASFFLERPLKGHFAINYLQLRSDPDRFREYYRMELSTFDYILEGIQQKIENKGPRAISPAEQLYVTIR